MAVRLADYMRRPIVGDRNAEALLKWSAYITQNPVTSKPSADDARLRIVAERIPMQLATIVEQTRAFFAKDETTQGNLRAFLSDLNTDDEEAQLADQLTGVIARQMPAYARQSVPEAQLQQWYTDNGFAEPEPGFVGTEVEPEPTATTRRR